MAAAKKTSTSQASKTPAKQAPAKKAPAKKANASKPAVAKQSTAKSVAKAPAKKAPTKSPAKSVAKAPAKKAPTKSPAKAPVAKTSAAKTPARASAKKTSVRPAPVVETEVEDAELPKPRFSKDGVGYTKDFDLAFVKSQHTALLEERVRLTGQAVRLEDEAHRLVEEAEMGDVQFDDEGGEGDTMVVERERDLALSAQAREAVTEIDAALDRIAAGTYGYSLASGLPIPRERLEAIPWSTVLVEEKVGGIGRR